jgi:uncharacterized membrane protein YcaP (DUF421 family)
METDLFGSTTDGFLQPIVATAITYITVIALVRFSGLRSFAKMSAFDFAATIATGSLIASTAIGATPIWSGLTAIAALLVAQGVVATLRRSPGWRDLIDNRPIVLMDGGQVLTANLRKAGMIEADLDAQLRLAGLSHREQARAVVLETSGDVSVVRGEGGASEIEDTLISDLRR